MVKRTPAVVVISDAHLGTYGAHANELANYLDSIDPGMLILNGDFIDGWSFSKKYFPQSHLRVLQKVIQMMRSGTQVIYLTGNHDEFLRKFSDLRLGNLRIQDKLVLVHNQKTHWIFHGDVFDVTMKHSRWLARLGGKGYDMLILLNRTINHLLQWMGRERISFSKRVKNSVKKAIKYINDFEATACELAIDRHYDYVICGHIHQPVIRRYSNDRGEVLYLNSGDWVENLTALECDEAGEWRLVHYHDLGLEEKTAKPRHEQVAEELPV